jgi:hypothetical protein
MAKTRMIVTVSIPFEIEGEFSENQLQNVRTLFLEEVQLNLEAISLEETLDGMIKEYDPNSKLNFLRVIKERQLTTLINKEGFIPDLL